MKTHYHIIDNFSERDNFFKKIVANIIFFISITKIPFRKNKLTITDYHKALKVIKKGDLVLVGNTSRISSYFIQGKFKHALLYIKHKRMIHAIADGVEMIKMINVFKKYDSMIILRPVIEQNKQEEIISKTIAYARKQIGKPYNFDFKMDHEKFICTDLIYASYKNGGFTIDFKKNEKGYLQKISPYKDEILYPDHFLDLDNKFNCVFLSENITKEEIDQKKK